MKICLIVLFSFIAISLSDDYDDDNDNKKECGIQNFTDEDTRIAYGVDAKLKEYPWMVSFQGKSPINDEYYHFCGGSIIDDRNILSAAHCFNGIPKENIIAVTDHINLQNGNVKKWQIEKITNHANYNKNTNDNDIALVKLKDNLKPYSSLRRPICLPSKAQKVSGEVHIAGWGLLKAKGEQSNVLQKATIKTVTKEVCNRMLGLNRITKNMICAKLNKTDSCKGDSGGPLMKSGDGSIYIGGIISFGTECALGYPGVYTKVTNYIDWINNNK